MIERQGLPEGLAEFPPGPELAARLATIDRSRLNGHDLVVLLQARSRQAAHEQAQVLADMAELAHCPPGHSDSPAARTPGVDEFAVDEIRAALCLTRTAADAALTLALDVTGRLPRVHAGMLAGAVDVPRARVFARETRALPTATARSVVDEVIDDAPTLTTGQLAARLRSLAITADPTSADRRRQASLARRRIFSALDPDGTVTLAGFRLPTDRAAVAAARIDDLARAAKRAGDSRTMDQLRADTFLDLLEGAAAAGTPGGRGGVELRVALTTLMGLSDQPGELAGWGPVVAEVAREVAERQRRSPWRVSVYDRTGRLVHHGPVRRRPSTADAEFVKARDRTCRAPGCRMPAHQSDLDHTQPYSEGGPSDPGNLGVLCRHDHRLKGEGGWRLRQISDGVFAWRSRQGHTYLVPPDPQPP
ncbi:DUF222 domain-containing protein [Solwaraspora sp. WMMD1047]|uniref:HNH endonuclease signature motif containing protein n=1 Tax=Solwaraspora sp. WMMD1047 TaxID=3016102 RepID=UPI0024160272|nr:HNH endonuclease signature motif containing protein [Solwaraspora sp. WMMD1047]MDG4829128.1 DUF222 domain-containing protein [Solwaraspora sp. WMMD1047]